MRFVAIARLLTAILLFGTACLSVVVAPTSFLWMVAVGATELGHGLALICTVVSLALWQNSRVGRVASALCIAAAVMAATPVLRACLVARDLPGQLKEAFGEANPSRSAPLIYADLFRGIPIPEIQAETLQYKSAGDNELSLDFYRAQSPAAAPVVIDIHGGSWRGGDNRDFVTMNRYFAGRGFAVAAVTYRLAPQWRFPAASDDVRAAIGFLRDNANTLQIDPNRIVLLGRSAGGQIALNVAYSAYSANDPGIRGVISFYASTDLNWSWEHPENPWVIDTRGVLADYLGGSPSEASASFEAASAIKFVTADVPPTLLLHGGRDELVSVYHAGALSERLAQADVPHFNVSLPWATHAFDYVFRGPGGQISTYAIEYFLDRFARP
jgi:acetyl esterase/lipase